MDVSAPARPLSQPRPTQAYYVPRRVLESGRAANDNSADGKKCVAEQPRAPQKENRDTVTPRVGGARDGGRKSPKETKNNQKAENNNNNNGNKQPREENRRSSGKISPKSDPRPAPAGGATPTRPATGNKDRKASARASPPITKQATMVQPVKNQLTMSEPRVLVPTGVEKSSSAHFSSPAPKQGVCICERPEKHVVCRRCGFECSGRVQVVCPLHPLKLSLMDLRECPNSLCRSIQIQEIDNCDQLINSDVINN